MRRLIRLCLLLLAFALPAPQTRAEIRSVEWQAPRTFGYVIGDRIDLTVTVMTDRATVLQPASVPRPGPLAYWLDLVSVTVTERDVGAERRHDVRMVVQTFYSALEPKMMEVPSFRLAFLDEGRMLAATVPPWPFLMSPLRALVSQPGDGGLRLQPDSPVPWVPAARARLALGAGGAVSAAALVLLAWNRAWPPFHRRPARPFAAARRAVRPLKRAPAVTPAYEAALLGLHRAFDAAAGRRVFAADLSAFLGANDRFRPASEEIGTFFAASRLVFFAGDPAAAMARLPGPALVALADRLAALERRAP